MAVLNQAELTNFWLEVSLSTGILAKMQNMFCDQEAYAYLWWIARLFWGFRLTLYYNRLSFKISLLTYGVVAVKNEQKMRSKIRNFLQYLRILSLMTFLSKNVDEFSILCFWNGIPLSQFFGKIWPITYYAPDHKTF